MTTVNDLRVDPDTASSDQKSAHRHNMLSFLEGPKSKHHTQEKDSTSRAPSANSSPLVDRPVSKLPPKGQPPSLVVTPSTTSANGGTKPWDATQPVQNMTADKPESDESKSRAPNASPSTTDIAEPAQQRDQSEGDGAVDSPKRNAMNIGPVKPLPSMDFGNGASPTRTVQRSTSDLTASATGPPPDAPLPRVPTTPEASRQKDTFSLRPQLSNGNGDAHSNISPVASLRKTVTSLTSDSHNSPLSKLKRLTSKKSMS